MQGGERDQDHTVMSGPYLSIVVPAYNEALRIRPTLEHIQRYLEAKSFRAELVVVDDGSTDGTAEVARQAGASIEGLRIVRNETNRGKGFSVRRGVMEARGELVLFTDADLSAPIEEADKLLRALRQGSHDAAVGSRALARELVGVRQPWFRVLTGRVFNLLVRVLAGLPIKDTQCGLKLFRRPSTLPAFELQSVAGFGFDPELLFLITRLGGTVIEVPVRWNDDRATRVRLLRDSVRMFADLVALRWKAILGVYPGNEGTALTAAQAHQ
jgi:glycosyltransferase involved in cell wall biosynthesis